MGEPFGRQRTTWAPTYAVMLGAAAASLGVTGQARAQLLNTFFPRDIAGSDGTPGVSVLSRARPEYEDPGIRVGDVVVRPQVAETFGYNDNLLGQGSGSGSALDWTDASMQARTDWSRNSLALLLGVNDRRYFRLPDQDETNWRASLGGTYEIGRDVASFSYQHLSTHQDPTDIDSANFDRPLAYSVEDVRTSYQIVLPRLTITPGFELRTYNFSNASENGVPVIEQQRNRNEFQEELTARYELRPQTSLVSVIRPTQVQYTTAVNGVRNPNATGVSVLGGMDYIGEGLWRYRALVGDETRSFANTYKSRSAPVAEADVTWNPTGLTTVTGLFTRTIEDAGSEDETGYTYTVARLSVDHEYRHNILLRGYIGLQNADYEQGRSQTLYQAGVSTSWLLNRYARLTASYDFLDSTAKGVSGSASGVTNGGNYTRNLYLLRIEFGRFDPYQ